MRFAFVYIFCMVVVLAAGVLVMAVGRGQSSAKMFVLAEGIPVMADEESKSLL